MRGELVPALGFNILVIPVALCLVLELIYRTVVLLVGARREIPSAIISLDVKVHLVVFGVYLCYAAAFLFQQF